MENASEALVMAGSVLVFIIALTVCMSSFSTAREGIDKVVTETELVEYAKDSNGYINFIESNENSAVRIVGAETIVSAMYRAVKENFVMYIKLKDYNDLPDPSIFNISSAKKTIYAKDGTELIKENDNIIIITVDKNSEINWILENKFYDKIKEKNFFEYLGEYQEKTSDAVSTENKMTKRIMTYIEK